MKTYFLSQDNDCNRYVIPTDNKKEWEEWCEIDEDDERSWEAPNFAEQVGGCPSLVTFSNFEIN